MNKLSEYGFREDYDPNNRIIRQDKFIIDNDRYFISTVDLGINFSYDDEIPLYYETMIFKNDDWSGIYCRRYETREQALNNHNFIIENLKYLYCYEKLDYEN